MISGVDTIRFNGSRGHADDSNPSQKVSIGDEGKPLTEEQEWVLRIAPTVSGLNDLGDVDYKTFYRLFCYVDNGQYQGRQSSGKPSFNHSAPNRIVETTIPNQLLVPVVGIALIGRGDKPKLVINRKANSNAKDIEYEYSISQGRLREYPLPSDTYTTQATGDEEEPFVAIIPVFKNAREFRAVSSPDSYVDYYFLDPQLNSIQRLLGFDYPKEFVPINPYAGYIVFITSEAESDLFLEFKIVE